MCVCFLAFSLKAHTTTELWVRWFEPPHDKTNKMTVRPAKTQISLLIRLGGCPGWSESQISLLIRPGGCPGWSESSLCAKWLAKDPRFLHADSEDSDQTGRMPRLIWVFAGRTVILLVLSWDGSFYTVMCQQFSNILYVVNCIEQVNRLMTKPTKWHVRPAKSQISLGIRTVWSVLVVRMNKVWVLRYALSAQRRLIRLGIRPGWPIRVFAGRTYHFVGFDVRRLKCYVCPYIYYPKRCPTNQTWLA